MTDPSTWTTYGSSVDPASQYEWDPDCPEHGHTPVEYETALALGFYATGIAISPICDVLVIPPAAVGNQQPTKEE